MKRSLTTRVGLLIAAGAAAFVLLAPKEAHAQALQTINYSTSFDSNPTSGWFSGGNAGYDESGPPPNCCSHTGTGNLWLNWTWSGGSNQWNSWNRFFNPNGFSATHGYCDVSLWTQTSSTFTDGLIDIWQAHGTSVVKLLDEYSISQSSSYTQQTFNSLDISAATAVGDNILVVFGFWGETYNQWIRIDDVNVQCWVYN